MSADEILALASRWLPLVQLASGGLLALASFVVASTFLLFTYRNNFGWEPLGLVTDWRLGAHQGDQFQRGTINFEIRNRRKYPIVVRMIMLTFPTIPIGQPAVVEGQREWH